MINDGLNNVYLQICKGTPKGEEILTDFLKNVISTDRDINGVELIIYNWKAKWIELSEEEVNKIKETKETKETILSRKYYDDEVIKINSYKKSDSIESNGIDIDYSKIVNFIKKHPYSKGKE
ncbi:hypothetical protein K2F43_00800 [Clostridium estertheticum]|uniref:hypothetical protein n=1 Tax=Clostridium estertheticum TaxID=238834 RepID=UPI001C6E11CC|nr:hypothetical protein [Clostridium estertheticum]MBW9169739.1 hypothetical protein [Clostridium estertheticum]WLC74753.1 hypothetical protein KTC99_18665 [Clostridium estertheticum]